jgi:hypothetical protein
MPASDAIHEPVRKALIKDGWTITDDPFTIEFEELTLFADLGAEYPLGAERAGQKLVVEAKSFRNPSPMNDFKVALGQYLIYRAFLEMIAPEHKLYLAVSDETFEDFLSGKALQFLVQRYQLALLVINVQSEEIVRWIS